MSEIVIAPLSHNALRDWPADHFVAAIARLLEHLPRPFTVSVIGTPQQRLTIHQIVRPFPADRVVGACRLSWGEVLDKLRNAACVIGNNSGIAHFATYLGVPTICIFGGSHQRTEWAPLGPSAVVLSREIGCSPCQLNHIRSCSHGVACLREITPEVVADAALAAMRGAHAVQPVRTAPEGDAAAC